MNFDPRAKLEELKKAATDIGTQKAVETMNQANQLSALMQNAGYQIGELNLELSVPPTITIDLKAGPTATNAKLEATFQSNKDNDVISVILGALIQANRLRDMVKLETIELKSVKLVLKTPPSISLQWKEKTAATAATAS